MGQAKQNRIRLGSWYGKSVVEGHPDFVAKVKKPAAQLAPIAKATFDDSFHRGAESTIALHPEKAEPNTSYVVTDKLNPSVNGIYRADENGTLHRTDDPLPDSYVPERRPHRPRPSFKAMGILAMAIAFAGAEKAAKDELS